MAFTFLWYATDCYDKMMILLVHKDCVVNLQCINLPLGYIPHLSYLEPGGGVLSLEEGRPIDFC